MEQVAIGDAPGRAGLSQAERLVDVFVAPSKTFADILRNTSWWLPFLLASLMSVATAFVVDRQVGYERVVENTLHDSPRQEEAMSQLTPEQRIGRIRSMAKGYRFSSFAAPLFILAFTAIGALGLWASFNFGLGAQTTYGQMFAVWMYASVPRLLTGLLTIITLYFGGNPESFNLKNPVGTNVAYYFPDATAGMRAALGFMDFIGIWSTVLLVIGTAIVARVSLGKAAAVVVGWWVLLLLVSTGMAVAFS